MCGIFLVINRGRGEFNISDCERALSKLIWRGPDLSAVKYFKNKLFIGHTVLSLTGENILEQSSTYCYSKSGRYRIALNGEIYNYREIAAKWLNGHLKLTADTTDTEVLANLYDVLPPNKISKVLSGMYAFIVLDELKNLVYISRDVQGEKGLYIYEDSTWFIASSEINPIKSLVGPLELNYEILEDYFKTRHFMQFSQTAYKNIRQLQPGVTEKMNFDGTMLEIVKNESLADYIDGDVIENNFSKSIDNLVDELDSLLIKSTTEMLPKERKYATVISGGVDSSLLAYYISKYGGSTSYVAINNVGKDYISNDLTGFERVLGVDIDVLNVNDFEYAADISGCQNVCGSPLPAHSFVTQSRLSRFVQSKGCKVIFGGEGADEYFGGYSTYLQRKTIVDRYSPSEYMSYDSNLNYMSNNYRSSFSYEMEKVWLRAKEAYSPFVSDHNDLIRYAMMYADSAYQLPSVGLRGADLMSMMWGVEARSIFLNKSVIKFALNLPIFAKVDKSNSDSLLNTKVILKKLFLRYYPENLLVKKQGFSGFPVESTKFLGNINDYIIFQKIQIDKSKVINSMSSQLKWKLANVEFFLRNQLCF